MTQAFQDALLAWYRESARDLPWRTVRDPYAVWVSEVMLQQTRVETVVPYYLRFMKAFPTLEALAEASEEDVLALWKGLGYYRRARMLHKGARATLGGIPKTRDELLRLPGVGDYTAGAIASIAFDEAVPAIDGNLIRVFARWLALRDPADRPPGSRVIESAAAKAVPRANPGEWNQAVMELGATVCVPRSPKCGACPVAACCEAHALGIQTELPVLAQKAPPVIEDWAVAVAVSQGRALMVQRPDEGLLARMWVFPMLQNGGPRALEDLLRRVGVAARMVRRLPDARHRFTHRVWRMTGWLFEAEEPVSAEGRWFSAAELASAPVPVAVRAYREAAEGACG